MASKRRATSMGLEVKGYGNVSDVESEDDMEVEGLTEEGYKIVVAVSGGMGGCFVYDSLLEARLAVELSKSEIRTFTHIYYAGKWLKNECGVTEANWQKILEERQQKAEEEFGQWPRQLRRIRLYRASVVRIRNLEGKKDGTLLSIKQREFTDWEGEKAKHEATQVEEDWSEEVDEPKLKKAQGMWQELFAKVAQGRRQPSLEMNNSESQGSKGVGSMTGGPQLHQEPYPFGDIRPLRASSEWVGRAELGSRMKNIALTSASRQEAKAHSPPSVKIVISGTSLPAWQLQLMTELRDDIQALIKAGTWTYFKCVHIFGRPECMGFERITKKGDLELLRFQYIGLRLWAVTRNYFTEGAEGLRLEHYPNPNYVDIECKEESEDVQKIGEEIKEGEGMEV